MGLLSGMFNEFGASVMKEEAENLATYTCAQCGKKKYQAAYYYRGSKYGATVHDGPFPHFCSPECYKAKYGDEEKEAAEAAARAAEKEKERQQREAAEAAEEARLEKEWEERRKAFEAEVKKNAPLDAKLYDEINSIQQPEDKVGIKKYIFDLTKRQEKTESSFVRSVKLLDERIESSFEKFNSLNPSIKELLDLYDGYDNLEGNTGDSSKAYRRLKLFKDFNFSDEKEMLLSEVQEFYNEFVSFNPEKGFGPFADGDNKKWKKLSLKLVKRGMKKLNSLSPDDAQSFNSKNNAEFKKAKIKYFFKKRPFLRLVLCVVSFWLLLMAIGIITSILSFLGFII